MTGKRYYWLRLHDDFFSSRRIRKLRRMEDGDKLCVIYLKMQLAAMKKDGWLDCSDPEDPPEEVLADDIGEESDAVRTALKFLLKNNLAECEDGSRYFFPYAVENTGSESASTQRVREYRKRQETKRNAEETSLALQCNANETPVKRECSVEKRREEKSRAEENLSVYPTNKNLFIQWCLDYGITDKAFAADFFDRYNANGWTTEDGSPVRNWKHFATAAWKKEKAKAPPSEEETWQAIQDWRERAKANSYTLDDCIEYPPGSGMYIGKDEYEAMKHG